MLRFLKYRENGTDDPISMVTAESTRRTYLLELNRFQNVEKKHKSGVTTLDLDPVEHRYLISGGSNGEIVAHDMHNLAKDVPCTYNAVFTIGKERRCAHKFSIGTVQWYPFDTGLFVTSGMDKTLKIWDSNLLKVADEFVFNGVVYSHSISLRALTHNLIAIGTQSSKVRMIDMRSGSATHTLRAHKMPVLAVQWSTRDEFLLASGGEDSKVYLWDIRSSKGCLKVLDQHNGDSTAGPNAVNTAHDGHVNSIRFTPSGLHLVTFGTDDRLRLWDSFSGSNMMVNFGRTENESRKGLKLAISDNTNPEIVFIPSGLNVGAYDMHSGELISKFTGHYSQVNCCVFNSDTQEMYSGGNDRNIVVWSPETSTVIAYEEYLKEGPTNKGKFTSRVGVADAWSSDEDD